MKKIGKFEIVSGNVLITDPCYTKGTWCSEEESRVKKGIWIAYIELAKVPEWGERVTSLIAMHEDCGSRKLKFVKASTNIGVDSGQAGIFDEQHYKDDSIVKDNMLSDICPEDKWYSMCCKQTLELQAGVIPFGCVASSGFGDGNYEHYIAKRDGEIDGIKIIFITDKELK